MNEEPKSVWKRPWEGRRKVFGWFLLLNVATFAFLLSIILGLGLADRITTAIWMALTISVSVSLVAFLMVGFVRWVLCWQNFKKFLFGVACFVTLIALFYAVENWRGKRAWENHRDELLAKGEKLSIAELAPPTIPDEQNFAMTRLLKPIMDFTQTSTNVMWHDTNGSARLQAISAELRMDSSDGKIKLGSVEEGTLADLASWQEFYLGNTNYPQPAASGEPAEVVLIALSKFDQEIRELIQAAKDRPLARFPIPYEHEPSSEILLPHLAHVKNLTQLLHVRVTVMLELREVDRAFEELKLGFRFSESLKDEPFLIDHLVRLATLNMNLQALREGVARHAWNEGQLVELQTRLASMDILAEYKQAIRGERAYGVGIVDYMRRHGVEYLIGGEVPLLWSASAPDGWSVSAPDGWFYQNMLTMSRLHEAITLATVDESAYRVHPDVANQISEAIDDLKMDQYHPYKYFAARLMPALSKAATKSGRMQTFVDAAQVACALERYRLANGALPDDLSALTPQFITRIPTDVIDGEPLRYRKTGDDSYIIYSVGWNQTDDGGEVGWTNEKETSVDISKGDWVWFHEGQ